MRLALVFISFLYAFAVCAKVSVDIPFEQFTLPNGLRVVVHTDRKAPIIAVNVWYHVGSKDEPVGKSGFAHLFEHLMFQGSENAKGEYFSPFTKVGATEQNGTTNTDRTNYFQNVPSTALDTALFMESDRMGHLLGAITQAVLDEQRGVVQNEKRQGENQPYGRSREIMQRAMYPKGHPYHHTTIGSMNDLNAASLEDVKTWFRSWYGPNNAVLVLAGDIDLATAKEKVTKYFGDIPASATVPVLKPMIAPRAKSTRETMTDRVAQPRITITWNVPQYSSPEMESLELFAQILAGSRSSRLAERLLYKEKRVDNITAFVIPGELGSTFRITAAVKSGEKLDVVEKAIREELAKLIDKGPTAEELARARTMFKAGFIRGIEKVGGFSGKSDVLAQCTVFMNDPGCFKDSLARIEGATASQIKASARKWLRRGDYTLTILPGDIVPLVEEPSIASTPQKIPAPDPKLTTTKSDIDRTKGVPITDRFPDLQFPPLQRATLGNGIKVIFTPRHDVPVVQMSMEFPGGFRSDAGRRIGTSNFTMSMLDEGAGKYGAVDLVKRKEALGAEISNSAVLDYSVCSLSALKDTLDESMALYADVIRRPRFGQTDFERFRASWIAKIQQEKTSPTAISARVIARLTYPEDHPYAIPFTGSGYESDIAALTRDDLVAWHKEQIRPDAATLTVVGDTSLVDLMPLLEKHFGDWRAEGSITGSGVIPTAQNQKSARVFLINQPGAIQTNIAAAQIVPSAYDPLALDFDIANGVFGGDFTSRLNMNLREDKHWSYGARSQVPDSQGQRLWRASAPVQIDKTIDALKEIQREISDFASGKAPVTPEEVARVQSINIKTLPGSLETAKSLLGQIASNNRFGRPDDYVVQSKKRIEAMTAQSVQALTSTIQPNALTWFIVGDLSKIEAGIRELGLGPVQVIDADGKSVSASE